MKAEPRHRIEHMLFALAQIRSLTGKSSAKSMAAAPVERAALERFFEIVSEASRHLPEEWKATEGSVPWRDIAALGNVLRHAYDGVAVERLFDIAAVECQQLEEALMRIERLFTLGS